MIQFKRFVLLKNTSLCLFVRSFLVRETGETENAISVSMRELFSSCV